jgi:DNA-binding NtrC family response regulator
VVALWDGGVVSHDLPERGTVTFGRGGQCDVVIDHVSVSRRHAALHLGSQLELEDLGSSNGSKVDGQRIGPGVRVPLVGAVHVEIGAARLLLEHPALRGAGDATLPAADGVAERPSMDRAAELIELVAPSHLSVILHGETGVGKELAAQDIHRKSRRADGPFLRLNCAAVPDALLESELFGYERGAFTGAVQAKSGLLEAARGGTMLFDEIGEMPLPAQAKLLRVLESREVTRVGGLEPRPIDVRFVAATHRRLPELVLAGAFREDLYFRLNGVSIFIPPLRERLTEVVPLSARFAAAAAASLGRAAPDFTAAALAALRAYAWPGNIRELKNAVERAAVVCGGTIDIRHLPPEVLIARPAERAVAAPASVPRPGHGAPMAASAGVATGLSGEPDAERQRIIAALEQCGGHQGRAAEVLGISRRTLLARLDAHQLPRPRKGQDPAKR